MKRLAGQAGRTLGLALQQLGMLILVLFSLLVLAFCVLAFRLSLGPLQIPYLASQLATAASGQGITIHIAQAALAWSGFHRGGGAPLYLRLNGITARNRAGLALAQIPSARLVFSPGILLGSQAPILVDSTDTLFNGSDVAVSLHASIRLGIGFSLAQADLIATLGPGRVGAGGDSEPITGGGFNAQITAQDVRLWDGHLLLTPSGGSAPVVTFSGSGHLNQGWAGALTLTADKVQAADLGFYWPTALAGQTRSWVTTNITAGAAHDASFTFGLAAPKNLSNVSLSNATGGFKGDGLALTWLPHAQQITGLSGSLALQNQDTVLITADHATLGGLALHDGTMKITGVSQADQIGIVKVAADGSLAAAFAVLNAPPLELLKQAPAILAKASGNAAAQLSVTLPLQDKVKLADVALTADVKLTGLSVPTPLDGISFTDGVVDLHATTRDLHLAGVARLAGQPAAIAAAADFQSPQVLRSLRIKTALAPALLAGLGLNAQAGVSSTATAALPVTLLVKATALGAEQATLDADLTPAALAVPILAWAKQPGTVGSLHVIATISDVDFGGIEQLDAAAPDLAIHGVAKNRVLQLTEIRIGRTVAQGTIAPATPGTPWRITLAGPVLDARAVLPPAKGAAAKQVEPSRAPPPGAPWQAQLNFATASLAATPAPALRDLAVAGSGKGGSVLAANAQAVDAAGLPVHLTITPASADGARRRFHLDAQDGGTLLRTLAAYDNIQGGLLALDGTYGAGAAFIGTASLMKFRLLKAPAIGKILQAITVYGAAEAASGPGLAFTRLIAPFSIANQQLTLSDARAYSASLGFTASGTIGLADGSASLEATIIPAYALNTLPGKIPLIGRLFSAEKGGGLFALRAKISGQLTNPSVRINPFSALTPGALRNVFGGPAKNP